MTTLKVLLFFLVSLNTFGQVNVDNKVKNYYQTAFKSMKWDYQQKVTELEKKDSFIGISIFTLYEVDTLNKEDLFINNGNIEIIQNNERNNEKETNENLYIPVFSNAEIINDTLNLEIGGFIPPLIRHKIYLQNETSVYEEYYKFDSVLRLNLNDIKVSKLFLPIKTKKFLISTSSYAQGQIIYGQVELETSPYYYDTFGFKNNYLKKRVRCVYVFKVRAKKNST